MWEVAVVLAALVVAGIDLKWLYGYPGIFFLSWCSVCLWMSRKIYPSGERMRFRGGNQLCWILLSQFSHSHDFLWFSHSLRMKAGQGCSYFSGDRGQPLAVKQSRLTYRRAVRDSGRWQGISFSHMRLMYDIGLSSSQMSWQLRY